MEAFNASLARTESGGNYGVVNSEGYAGKYQFGKDRIADYNRATGSNVQMDQFVRSPELQERVQAWHIGDIDAFIRDRGLDRFVGQNVGGATMTIDAMRAMAHLGGKGGMAKFLLSGGQHNPADSNGTSLLKYAQVHGGATGQQQPPQAAPQPQVAQQAPQPQQPQRPSFQTAYIDPRAFQVEAPRNQLAAYVVGQNPLGV